MRSYEYPLDKKNELSELVSERRCQTSALQSRLKRLNSCQSTIDKTRSMLKLIDDDIQFWKEQVEQGKLNQQTSINDVLLTAIYLSQFNVDQRRQLIDKWQKSLLTTRANFNPLQLLSNQKGFI